jgi:hypothetical protein
MNLRQSSLSARLNRLRTIPKPLIFIAFFALLGTVLMFATRAAGPFAGIEPEQGSGLAAISDQSASGGAYVQFGGKFGTIDTTSCNGVTIQPGENIQAKIDANPGGTTFCFAPGVHRLASVVFPKSNSTLIGLTGAVLNGSKHITSFGRSGSWWTITGQTQEFTPLTGNDPDDTCADTAYTGCHLPDGVFRDDAPLFQVTSLNNLGPGKFYFDRAADTIYLGDDPAGRKIEVTVSAGAIKGYGGATGQQYVTVRNFIVEKFAASTTPNTAAAIDPGLGWKVENNEVRLNSNSGISVIEQGEMRGNYIHHNGQYGYVGGPLDTSLIENNEISYNNTAGFHENWNAGGSKIIRSKNVTIRGNYVHHNTGPGLATDWENYKIVYENNTFEYNTGIGLSHEASADAIIRNNKFKNNMTSYIGKSIYYMADIYLHDSKNTEIYGNVVETEGNPLGLNDADRGSTIYGVLEVRDVYVHDNTFTIKPGREMGLVGRPTAFSANNRFQNNTYYVSDLNGTYWVWQDLKTKAQWQALGHDTTGIFKQY